MRVGIQDSANRPWTTRERRISWRNPHTITTRTDKEEVGPLRRLSATDWNEGILWW